MTTEQFLTFLLAPAMALMVGFAVKWLADWQDRREERLHPGE